MIISLTDSYESFRNKFYRGKTKNFNFKETILPKMKFKLQLIENLIEKLKERQNRQTLPSFQNRKKMNDEINSIKIEISRNFEFIKNRLVQSKNLNLLCICTENCDCQKYDNILIKNFQTIFYKNWQNLLIEYRVVQQNHLKRSTDFAIFDELENNKSSRSQIINKQEIIQKSKKEELRNSIFSISTTLVELKSLLCAQSFEIDRIDVHMDRVNMIMNKSTMEIEKFKKREKSIKDNLIIFLFSIVLILFLMVLFKIEKNKLLFF